MQLTLREQRLDLGFTLRVLITNSTWFYDYAKKKYNQIIYFFVCFFKNQIKYCDQGISNDSMTVNWFYIISNYNVKEITITLFFQKNLMIYSKCTFFIFNEENEIANWNIQNGNH
ncbi:hypothetical protein BpHYR1_045063 [Brachionus plicatilis]|uniref:Uncharacterized protein n=1 Tax=Brachionus plicatilis TaxID=10195 RepID=A0A3M7SLS5_BRAPC|nr:hypothetical protein BpHYR1_045063 [Brachionus plicatilis]